MVVFVLITVGCGKDKPKVSADSSVVEGAKTVVNAAGDALRNVVKGVNDAVYGGSN